MDSHCSGMLDSHRPGMDRWNFHSKNKPNSVFAYAARKQHAVFAVPRPFLGKPKFTGFHHFRHYRHLEHLHVPLPSYYRPKQYNHYNDESKRAREQLGERWSRPRLSRSLSPNRRERKDAYDKANPFFDYAPPNDEDMEFYSPLSFYQGDNDSDSEDEWEDECRAVDELDASGPSNTSRYKREELEYLKRMLIKYRNRKKELFPYKRCTRKSALQKQLPHHVCSYYDSCGREIDYERRLRPSPSPRSIYYDGKSTSRYRTNDRVDVHCPSQVLRSSLREQSPLPPVPNARRSNRYCASGLGENLKTTTNTRTYPARAYGRALHIQRWLSDRYTERTRFDFGDLPKSEGVKDSYIQDPNDPNKFLNVPRPLKPLPGSRGDYYNGAAWKDHQKYEKEWFKKKGCHYPDTWIRCVNGATMAGGIHREDREKTDIMMCDEQSDSTVRQSRLHGGSDRRHTPISWPNWRDQSDMESVTSKDDFSISTQTDSVAPQTIVDHSVDSISIGIANTMIDTASLTPASSEKSFTNRIEQISPMTFQPTRVESGTNGVIMASKEKKTNIDKFTMGSPSLVVLSDPEVSKAFRVALSKPLRNARSSLRATTMNNVGVSTISATHHRSVSINNRRGIQNSSTVASSTHTLAPGALIPSPKFVVPNNGVTKPGGDWDRDQWKYHF